MAHAAILVSHALCPCVQSIAIALAEKRVAHDRLTVDLARKPDWFLGFSPLGRTPVPEMGGEALFESAAILEYREETQPPPLHPADPVERARHRAWIGFGSECLSDIAGSRSFADGRALEAKTAWCSQITGAGLGPRLGNAIRSQKFPMSGESLDAAALVRSKAPAIVGAHDTGPLIRSKDGFWLAIPTEAAGRGLRGGRITPGEWERRRGLRLRFVYRRPGPSLLVAEGRLNSWGLGVASRSKTGRGRTTVPIFLLVPQGQVAEAARPRKGCRAGARQRAGVDRRELGGGQALTSAWRTQRQEPRGFRNARRIKSGAPQTL